MIKEIRYELDQRVDVSYAAGTKVVTFIVKGYDGEIATVDLDERNLIDLRTIIQEVLTLFPVDP